jgi:hypothetical protein
MISVMQAQNMICFSFVGGRNLRNLAAKGVDSQSLSRALARLANLSIWESVSAN